MKCNRQATGSRTVNVSPVAYRLVKAEAARRGISVTALVDELLRPIVVQGEA